MDTVAVTSSESSAGVDVGAAVTAAVAGLRGDVMGALDAMKPTIPGGSGTVGGLTAAALAALLAWSKHREASAAKADGDEGWDLALKGRSPPAPGA